MSNSKAVVEINYEELEKEFELNRRPYITLAVANKKMQDESQNASFHFIVYRRNRKNNWQTSDFASWTIDFNKDRFKTNIINKIEDYKKEVDTIFLKNNEGYQESLIQDSIDAIKNWKENDQTTYLEAILAVYHLTFNMEVPMVYPRKTEKGLFLNGIIHCEKHLKNNKIKITKPIFYFAELIRQEGEILPLVQLPKIKRLLQQIDNSFYEEVLKKDNTDNYFEPEKLEQSYRSFFGSWMPAIQAMQEVRFDPFYVYCPIYDGLKINEGILRGYLTVNWGNSKGKDTISKFLRNNLFSYQNEINNAYLKGTHNSIVDNYASLELDNYTTNKENPVIYWAKHLHLLHNWDNVRFVNEPDINSIWYFNIKRSSVFISLSKVLSPQHRPSVIREAEQLINDLEYDSLELIIPKCDKSIVNIENILANPNHPYFKKRVDEIIGLLDDILERWLLMKKLKDSLISATSAAISQVMARNMSHNIGSHVLSKLTSEDLVKQIFFKNKLNDKNQKAKDTNSKNFDDWTFYQCINKVKEVDYKLDENEILNDKVTYELLIANFFDFLRKRMDYLADVTTSTPVIENSKGFYNDIVSQFIQNRVLNDRISGISEFNYEIILCKPVNHESHCPGQETTSNCKEHSNKYIIGWDNDFQVSIPNDVVGNHAFYTILENIIRNTAKHAEKTENGNVEFKIKVQEANELYKEFISTMPDTNFNEFYAVSIFDNCQLSKEKLEELVENQNIFLNNSVLDKKTNQLRQSHWGLIEMDASAAYLRKISVEQIDSDDYEISDLSGKSPVSKKKKLCIFQAYAEQNKYLGYRLFIRKPHEVLIIQNEHEIVDLLNDNSVDLKDLEIKGVWIKSTAEIEKEISINKASPHKIVVISSGAKEFYEKLVFNPLFSRRIVKVENNDDIEVYTNIVKTWNLFYQVENEIYHAVRSEVDFKKKYAIEHHGTNYCAKLYGDINDPNSKCKFIEISYSATDHFFPPSGHNALNKKHSWPLKIAIIDERIQSNLTEKYSIQQPPSGNCNSKEKKKCFHKKGVPYTDLYKNTNVIVPSIETANLNHQFFSEDYQKIIDYISFCTKKISINDERNGNGLDDKPCEFVVIHLGIIEKLITAFNEKNKNNKDAEPKYFDKDKQDEVDKFIKTIILGISNPESMADDERKTYDSIVLTSGRGKPHNLPKDVRYLNFSAVSQYLSTQRNKYALTEALYSARNQK